MRARHFKLKPVAFAVAVVSASALATTLRAEHLVAGDIEARPSTANWQWERSAREDTDTTLSGIEVGSAAAPVTLAAAVVTEGADGRTSALVDGTSDNVASVAEENAMEAADAGAEKVEAGAGNAEAEVMRAAEADSDVEHVGFTRRPYAMIGAGTTLLEPRSHNNALTVGDDTDSGFHLALGYDIMRMLSAELYLADLGEAGMDFLDDPVGVVDYQVYGLSAVLWLLNSRDGFVPLSRSRSGAFRREGLSMFLKAGVGAMNNDSDLDYQRDHDVHAAFGAGLEYGFGNGFGLRGEYNAYDTDAKYLSLALLKRFGRVREAEPELRHAAPVMAPVEASDIADDTTMQAVIELPVVHFAFDHSDITDEEQLILDIFVEEALNEPFQLLLRGHTDWIGTEDYNLGLSRRRAESVKHYLVDHGIKGNRIATEGVGESEPIVSNETEEGRAENRRTEILIEP
ncbi:MAG: hypothetical protein CSB44_11365 [Gammaproteobacteria bacterium]|nr:MAG: hypothetical protein CSB44_11365 [Gammaproteobacteria bacterium]